MWSATPIASQNWLSKPQTKFGVHWPKPRGQKKRERRELGGATEKRRRKKSVTTEWSLTTYDSSTPRLHPAFIHGHVHAHLSGCERHWAGFWEALLSLSCSIWLLLHGCRTGRRPSLIPLFSTIFSLFLIQCLYRSTHQAAALCTARWQIAAECTCVSVCLIKKKRKKRKHMWGEWEKIRL